MDYENNLYERPIGIIAKRNLDKKRDSFIRNYISFIMNSKIISDTTKLYIRSSSSNSVAAAIKNYNQTASEDEAINIKTAQSKINYDINKLLKYFPDNMLSEVLVHSSCNLDDYIRRLNLAIADYSKKNKLLDNLDLKIARVAAQESLEEDEFNELISIIKPYIKSHMRYIEENLDTKACGYLLYLMSTPQLDGENKERYNLVKQLLE
ncbi:hypothetical protein GKZ28_05265 [Clostridium chromiireducens]|uniref:Uncharacterized protein n=1 Tax=Clostridium chromiireducens TaxID=225345 RepID=A0A964RK86_9CLOT|nr:hypothetical protein [Clostridium chromiireducens]MVX63107.1 hypothetical protein [Clostridium chromiireducens]